MIGDPNNWNGNAAARVKRLLNPRSRKTIDGHAIDNTAGYWSGKYKRTPNRGPRMKAIGICIKCLKNEIALSAVIKICELCAND